MSYRWIITKDRFEGDAVGVRSGTANSALKSNPQRFSIYDDDRQCYAEGMMYSTDADHNSEEALFAPIDNFGLGAWGCELIKVDGEFV